MKQRKSRKDPKVRVGKPTDEGVSSEIGDAADKGKKFLKQTKKVAKKKRKRGRFICCCGNPDCPVGPFNIWYEGL